MSDSHTAPARPSTDSHAATSATKGKPATDSRPARDATSAHEVPGAAPKK